MKTKVFIELQRTAQVCLSAKEISKAAKKCYYKYRATCKAVICVSIVIRACGEKTKESGDVCGKKTKAGQVIRQAWECFVS